MKVSVVFSKKNKTDLKGYLFLTYVKRDRGIVEKKKVSLDYSLSKEQFDKYFNKSFCQFIPNKKIDFDEINDRIIEKMKDNPFIIKVEKQHYKFLEYMETRKKLKNNYSTINTYDSSSNMFKKFLLTKHSISDMDFHYIDGDFIIEMEKFFSNEGLQFSTIRFYFNNYSTIFNNAIKKNVYIGKNPFNDHKVQVSAKPKKILSDEDVM